MNSDSKKSRREKYQEELETVRNSDMGMTEKSEAISEVREKYYDSKYEERREDVEEMDDPKRYVFILGGGFIMGMLGLLLLQSGGGFVMMGALGLFIASAFLTKPGIDFMESMGEVIEAMDDSEQQQQSVSASKSSESKRICSECGWQNPQSNNYCHDCGSKMAE